MSEAAKSVNELNSDLFEPETEQRFLSPVEARKKAMDYLARREYGQHELQQKLILVGYDSDIAVAAVEQLTQDGLQDDRRFVENFVQSRINQGKGPARIEIDLGQRKIKWSLVEVALDAAEVDWCELAGEVRRKKFGDSRPDNFKEKARQMRFLQYRGFAQDHIQAAMLATDS